MSDHLYQLRHNGHRAVQAHDGLRNTGTGLPPRTPARCTRCNCKLSTYRPPQTTLCAPCQAAT